MKKTINNSSRRYDSISTPLCQVYNPEKKYPELTLMPYGKKWTLQPKIEWVQEIVQAADRAGVAVFLKDNLRSMLCDALVSHKIERQQFFKGYLLRQELPDAKTEDKP
jgi:hypothetical protein